MKTGKITWRSPSNIALVKYWGKRPVQLPANPNLSMTLQKAYTEMTLEFAPDTGSMPWLEFRFEGRKAIKFEDKIARYLESLKPEYTVLNGLRFRIDSHNTFPHSTGIASSASSMSALGLCLASIIHDVSEMPSRDEGFFRLASHLARLASGSACRSVYGGYTIWGRTEGFPETSDDHAVPVPFEIHPVFREMRDAILVVSSKEKEVSSRAGHELMVGHPYAEARFRMANANLKRLVASLQSGDAEEFVRITELEALNLHGLMMSSENSYLLLEPGTLSLVQEIRRFRNETSIPVCFTLDAGPNIHLLYPAQDEIKVKQWIESELAPYLENNYWIDDQAGPGPLLIGDGY